ncbi:transcriptional regulator, LysR family [Burkholderia pseudomallei]|nr:transcriptional regulator, LysR family [Burkholderia pseudomallei]
MLAQHRDERAQLRRHVLAVRVVEPHRRQRPARARQHLAQRAAAQVVLDALAHEHERDARARARGVDHRARIGADEAAGDVELDVAAAVAQRPFVQAAALRKAKADAHVSREIGELRRHAVLREIAGRRDERARERGRDLHAHHPGL